VVDPSAKQAILTISWWSYDLITKYIYDLRWISVRWRLGPWDTIKKRTEAQICLFKVGQMPFNTVSNFQSFRKVEGDEWRDQASLLWSHLNVVKRQLGICHLYSVPNIHGCHSFKKFHHMSHKFNTMIVWNKFECILCFIYQDQGPACLLVSHVSTP